MRKKLITKEVTEDFWRDCLDMQDVKSSSEYIPFSLNTNENKNGRNNLKKSKNNHNNYVNIIQNHRKKKNIAKYRSNNKTIENESFMKVYKNHPILQENIKTNKFEKETEMRKKNAMNRCLGLYVYGVEVKKQKLLNDENNKKERIKDEISPCTFRPKISKYAKTKQYKFNPENYFNYNKKSKNIKNKGNSNGDYRIVSSNSYDNGIYKNTIKIKIKNQNKTIANDEEDISYVDECTFKPKIPRRDIKKVFGKSKSLANEKDNEEFFIRYARAREDYMIKKFKKIYIKDDSYDTTLLSLANRFNNKHYKNGLNNFYDVKNQKNNNRMNLSMDSPTEKKNIYIDKDIISNLRNDLLTLDLNEED